MKSINANVPIGPYADHHGDGIIQLSFTVPLTYSNAAKQAALRLIEKMGLAKAEIVHAQHVTEGFTYIIAYAQCPHRVDKNELTDEIEERFLSRTEVEQFAATHVGRRIVVVGASTGTDTHSLGIDAMLNMKGFDGESGLEAYECFETHNLGSQVPNGELIERAISVSADVILVSQTVTQQKLHVHNLTQLADMAQSQGIRDRILMVCGGPRISNELAKELGYDAGFSKGCYPNHLASFIVRQKLMHRQSIATARVA